MNLKFLDKNKKREQIKNDLLQFNGTNQYFYHPLFKGINYTDGIRYVMNELTANWLIIDSLANLTLLKKHHEFIVIKLMVENSKGVLTFDDGDGNVIKTVEYSYTDFPLEAINFFYENGVLYLPNER